MKKLINSIGDGLRSLLAYVGKVFEDKHGAPSSNRWAGMFLVGVFAFTTRHILSHPTGIDWVIALIVLTCEMVLILVLFGYSAFAEKVINVVSGKIGGDTRPTE